MEIFLHGIPVVLHSRVQTGVDKFNAPVYTETSETVDNVLVQPVSAEAIVNDLQLYGHRAAYELCIPKGDAHNWTGCRVEFFGQSWRVYTPVEEWIETMVPLDWNKKVRVERYDKESPGSAQ